MKQKNKYFSINNYDNEEIYGNFRYENESLKNEIDELLELIESEKNIVRARMFSEVNTTSSEEREKEGRTITNLKCEIHIRKYGNLLEFSRTEKIKTDIKTGDVCIVTITNTDIKNVNCKIKEITSNSITIISEEKIPKFNKNNLARIDLIINETTFHRWENNLKKLSYYGKKALKLKIGGAPETYNLNKNIKFINKQLDDYQKEAVKHSVNCNDFFLIHGPFGTGKTTTIVELILQEINLGHNVLVTAESNVAIDNILKKLEKHKKVNKTRVGDLNKISQYLKNHTLNYKFKNHPSYDVNIGNEERLKIEEEILLDSHVILATNSTVARKSLENIDFDIAIIDEASQATIPSTLIPINKAKKFILIGDHKQLPPVILNNECQHLKTSLFKELIENYPQQSKELLIQYRMNEILMEFPNRKFYENKLKCSENSKNYYLDKRISNKYDSSSPLIFIDTSEHKNNNESQLNSSNSYVNILEAEISLEIAQMYLNAGINKKDMGIIATYADQVRLINKKTIVDVKSVDGFQGGERDIIIASMVRSNDEGNIGYLKDMKRLNVTLTRAKKKLIIIGNKKTFESNKDYKEFLEFCETIGGIKKI